MLRTPRMKRCFERGSWVRRRSLPLLLIGLVVPNASLGSPPEVGPEAMSAVSKAPPPLPKPRGSLKPKPSNKPAPKEPMELLPQPSAVVTPPILPKDTQAERLAERAAAGQYHPYVEVSGIGLLIGDYQIQPRLVLGTDNRLDDVNVRERALRDEMDALEAKKRGEIKEDAITLWLRTRGRSGLTGIDPGFQVAYALQRVLRSSIRLAPMLEYSPPGRTAIPQTEKR